MSHPPARHLCSEGNYHRREVCRTSLREHQLELELSMQGFQSIQALKHHPRNHPRSQLPSQQAIEWVAN